MTRKKQRRPAPAPAPAPAAQANPGKLAIQAQYDAARHGRRLASWNPPSSGPNRAVAGLQTIRNRARDAGRNEWTAAAFVRNMVTDLVGTGITARTKTSNAALKAKLNRLWSGWIPDADADGVLDFYGQEALVVRTWAEAGECFARFRSRRIEDDLEVPLQVQLLEPDMCPLFDRDLPNGNRIRQGIELNRIGKRVNYWMWREHPGDFAKTASLDELVPIPADQIAHIYDIKRPGQLRGVPEMAPVLIKMKVGGDLDDAMVEKAKLQNLYAGFITKPDASAEGTDPLTGQQIQYDASGSPMVSLEPGGMVELAPGEDVTFSNPPAADIGYANFMRQQNLGIASGAGMPYETLTGDLTNISDRTLRVQIQQYRRTIEQKLWLVVVPMFCQKVREAWADAAVLAGALTLAEAAEAKNVNWAPQAWAYIHPVQDAQSKVIEVNNGFTSRSAVISARGDDPEEIDTERAADLNRELDMGIKQPVADPAPLDKQPKALDEALIARATAETNTLNAQTARLQAPPVTDPEAAARAALMERIVNALEPAGGSE